MKRVRVGLLGCSGVVGQNYLVRLQHHPWFEVTFLAGGDGSRQRLFGEVVRERGAFGEFSPAIANLPLFGVDDTKEVEERCDLLISCIGERAIAAKWEAFYASKGLIVISNTSAHREVSDVPVIIPEINPDHLGALHLQRERFGTDRGGIVTKPNCTVQSYLTPLFALHTRFRLKRIIVTTLQAVSGAGYPGVSSLDMIDNVIPYIEGEEEKSEREPLKILGSLTQTGIAPLEGVKIAAHCNRVPVLHGHTACVSVEFDTPPDLDEVKEVWRSFRGLPQELNLPSAPHHPICVRDEVNRPQPRLDRETEGGMSVVVGRLRPCPVLDIRFVALTHNVIRGAAGGGILNAELIVKSEFWA